MKYLKIIIPVIFLSILFVSCKHTDDPFLFAGTRPYVSGKYLVTSTGASLRVAVFNDFPVDTQAYQITMFGSVSYADTSVEILEYGHVYSTQPEPEYGQGDSAVVSMSSDIKQYTDIISNLKMLTVYYIRSYVKVKTSEGKEKIGYNPNEIEIATISAKNEWIARQSVLAISRKGAMSFTIDNLGYFCAGDIGLAYAQDMWYYDPDVASWTQRASIPGKRGYGVAFAIGGKAYAGLGQNINGKLDDFYVYDQSKNKWSVVNDISNPFSGGKRTKAVAFAIGDYGYVGTGDVGAVDGDFYKFNPSDFEAGRNFWTPVNSIGIGRKEAVAVVIGDNAYVGLGIDKDGKVLNDLYVYSPSGDRWRTQSSLPDFAQARYGAFAFGIWKDYADNNFQQHGELYIGGGIAADSSYLEDCWMFIPEENQWYQRASYPKGIIANASAFSLLYQRKQESFPTMKGFVVAGYNGTKFVNYLYEFLP